MLILDTNVVLDWLVFGDAGCNTLAQALTEGRARWVATEAMRDELARVLDRGELDAWNPDLPALWAEWDRWVTIVPAPPPLPPEVPRCTDPDDQKFIDLGVHLSASRAAEPRPRSAAVCTRPPVRSGWQS